MLVSFEKNRVEIKKNVRYDMVVTSIILIV